MPLNDAFCLPKNWNQGKATYCIQADAQDFVCLRIGIKAKLDIGGEVCVGHFVCLRIGIKAKPLSHILEKGPYFVCLRIGIKAKL